ncbi:hypothetical protein K504DRAFT_524571 [Pleomassaria siparia CBS 279.74]|uniref:Uncharacterized protein n=1 Tax=Pleomassaria siparia CBS 279.74 TaxID=1314801 RepID=A0A6G1JQC4_9PLEO|nr:hypothetical protein K504DRAFT_524571 [Pleomassaria siparia CBS 279.74]
MPTHAELCNLNTSPDRGVPVDGDVNRSRKRDTFLFAQRARESGASTNLLYGMLLGFDGARNKVWASLTEGIVGLYACDAPARALIMLAIVKDVKVAGIPAVLITTPSSLEVVA